MPHSDSQEGEEDNTLDAEKLGERCHGLQLVFHGLVEEHQAIHCYKLGHVVDHEQIHKRLRETKYRNNLIVLTSPK